MANSTGIVLTATAISFSNEWLNTGKPNFRVGVAGLTVALIFDGIEKINERAAVGLSVMMLITVMVVPFQGKSPAETLLTFTQIKPLVGGPVPPRPPLAVGGHPSANLAGGVGF